MYKFVRPSLHTATLRRIQIPLTCPQSNLLSLANYRMTKLRTPVILRFQRARI